MRSWLMLATVALTGCVFAQGRTMSVQNMVMSGDWAYFVAPPRMITDDLVGDILVSPNGRYTLIWGQELPGKKFAPLFDAFANKTEPVLPKPVFRIWDVERETLTTLSVTKNSPMPEQNGLVWSSRPGYAFQTRIDDSGSNDAKPTFVNQLWRLNAADGTYKLIANDPDTGASDGTVYCSPTKPIVVVVRWKADRAPNKDGVRSTLHIRVYDLDGKETKRVDSDYEGYLVLDNTWLADGAHLVGSSYKRGDGPEQRVQTKVVFDTATGTITPTSEKLAVYEPPPANAALATKVGPVTAELEKSSSNLQGLWLVATAPGEQVASLVTGDFDGKAELLPSMKTLLYLSRSRLYSCEIAKMDKALYLQAKAAAERTAALSRAKQIGTAVAMFSADNNDLYPDPSSFRGAVDPYVKNDKLFDGFVYTFKGGSASAIEDPSRTELGYISVPGGRCVVYADTHAKYVKDNP